MMMYSGVMEFSFNCASAAGQLDGEKPLPGTRRPSGRVCVNSLHIRESGLRAPAAYRRSEFHPLILGIPELNLVRTRKYGV